MQFHHIRNRYWQRLLLDKKYKTYMQFHHIRNFFIDFNQLVLNFHNPTESASKEKYISCKKINAKLRPNKQNTRTKILLRSNF